MSGITIYQAEGTSDIFTEEDLREQYDDILDSEYPDGIVIAGCTYFPSTLLKRADEVAYDCGFADFTSDYVEHTVSLDEWLTTEWEDIPELLGL